MCEAYKNERRQVNQKSYGLKKGKHIGIKERRQDRDGECRELIDGVVSEELGVVGTTPISSHRC